MKTNHTPGPWRVCGRNIWSDTRCLAIVRKRGQTNVFDDENQANARLIAEAPAMFEALTRLCVSAGEVDALEHAGLNVPSKVWSDLFQTGNEARAILARITGGQNE